MSVRSQDTAEEGNSFVMPGLASQPLSDDLWGLVGGHDYLVRVLTAAFDDMLESDEDTMQMLREVFDDDSKYNILLELEELYHWAGPGVPGQMPGKDRKPKTSNLQCTILWVHLHSQDNDRRIPMPSFASATTLIQ